MQKAFLFDEAGVRVHQTETQTGKVRETGIGFLRWTAGMMGYFAELHKKNEQKSVKRTSAHSLQYYI